MNLIYSVFLLFVILLQQFYINILLHSTNARESNNGASSEKLKEFNAGGISHAGVTKNKKLVQPLSCKAALQNLYDSAPTLTNKSDINLGFLFGRLMNTSNPFWLSFHNPDIDQVRGTTYARGKYYEHGFTKIYNDLLKDKEPGIVIDVGMNIGWYAFLSASFGHQVHAFEPISHNHLRFCQSLYLNQWDDRNISCYPNGLGDVHGLVMNILWEKNIGAANFSNEECPRGKCSPVMLTTLDTIASDNNWFDPLNPPLIHLLKIDVEGSEQSVVRGATKLISAKNILNILTEYRADRKVTDMTDFIMKCGYELHEIGNWAGASVLKDDVKRINQLSASEQSMELYNTCKSKISTRKMSGPKACQNLWWKLKM